MLSFYNITVSKREWLKRDTQWGKVIHSPPFLLCFYSYQKKAQDPPLAFQSPFKPFPFSVRKTKLFNTNCSLSTFKHFPCPRNPSLKYHTRPQQTLLPSAEGQQPTGTISLHTWLLAPVNESHGYNKYLPQSLNVQHSLQSTDRSWFYSSWSCIAGFQRGNVR